jgi:HSP20 family protein
MDMNRLREDFGNTWKWLAEGWRHLSTKAANALTYFSPANPQSQKTDELRWGLMAVDVEEHGDHLLVELEAPGLAKDDIDVSVDANRLVITGTKHTESERHVGSMHIKERAFGSFQRVVPLPDGVTADGAEASYKRGVLKLKIPKKGTPSVRRIDVIAG